MGLRQPMPKRPTAPQPQGYVEPEFKRDTAPVKAGGQFDLMKKQAQQRLSGQADTARDAMNRRFAQLGNLNSGASMKMEQQLQDQTARQQEEALGGIDIQAAQDVSAREMARDQSENAREQATLQRRMAGSQFDRSFGEQLRQAQFQEGIAGQEHELSKLNTLINTGMALESVKRPEDVLGFFDSLSSTMPGMVNSDVSAALSRRAGVNRNNRAASAWNMQQNPNFSPVMGMTRR